MKVCVARAAPAEWGDGVPVALTSPEALADALGLRLASVEPEPGGQGWEVTVFLPLWRELSVRLRVARLPAGLAWSLVEGELVEVAGRVWADPAQGAPRLVWEQELEPALSVPPALLRELAGVVVPAWLDAIALSPLREAPSPGPSAPRGTDPRGD